METVTGLNLPWFVLASRLVTLSDDGKQVLYRENVPAVQLGATSNKKIVRVRLFVYYQKKVQISVHKLILSMKFLILSYKLTVAALNKNEGLKT